DLIIAGAITKRRPASRILLVLKIRYFIANENLVPEGFNRGIVKLTSGLKRVNQMLYAVVYEGCVVRSRGSSPTVREGSAIPWRQSEPSLTVGLLPRFINTRLGYCIYLLTHSLSALLEKLPAESQLGRLSSCASCLPSASRAVSVSARCRRRSI